MSGRLLTVDGRVCVEGRALYVVSKEIISRSIRGASGVGWWK